jgi:hypothetical protein
MAKDSISGVRGRVTLWRVTDSGLTLPVHTQPNQIQYSWGTIAARQIGYRRQAGRPDYHVSAMYIEYENVATPEDPVTEDDNFDRTLGIEHYNALSGSRDYLRVALTLEPTLGISTDYAEYFTPGENGNQLTFFAQSSGTAGVNALPFSHAVNSKVYAAALVATPDFNDRTKDVVFARTVFDLEDQITKEASSQIGITWDIAFE